MAEPTTELPEPIISKEIELEHHVVDLKFFAQSRGTIVVFRGVRETLENVDRDWVSKGDRFFMESGLNLIRVVPKWRTFYRTDDIVEFLPTLRTSGLLDAFPGVATYGVSMGGFGAFAYAKALGAVKTVAIGPFSTLSPEITPWEDRWPEASNRLNWSSPFADAATEADAPVQALIFYDPLTRPDRLHMERLLAPRKAAGLETFLCRLPGAGHDAFLMLAAFKLLQPMMNQFLFDCCQPHEFHRLIRPRRRLENYYTEMSLHARVKASPLFQEILQRHQDTMRRDGRLVPHVPPATPKQKAAAATAAEKASSETPNTPKTPNAPKTSKTPWALMPSANPSCSAAVVQFTGDKL